jgi:hypothetical protein
MLKVKIAGLSANKYLMSDFLNWSRILFRESHW